MIEIEDSLISLLATLGRFMTHASWIIVAFTGQDVTLPQATSFCVMVSISAWTHQSVQLHLTRSLLMDTYRDASTIIIPGGAALSKGLLEWWRADGGLPFKPTFAHVVIASCAFLHNVCLDTDGDVAQDILDPQPPPREPLADNESSGNATRDRLAALVSGHVQAP